MPIPRDVNDPDSHFRVIGYLISNAKIDTSDPEGALAYSDLGELREASLWLAVPLDGATVLRALIAAYEVGFRRAAGKAHLHPLDAISPVAEMGVLDAIPFSSLNRD